MAINQTRRDAGTACGLHMRGKLGGLAGQGAHAIGKDNATVFPAKRRIADCTKGCAGLVHRRQMTIEQQAIPEGILWVLLHAVIIADLRDQAAAKWAAVASSTLAAYRAAAPAPIIADQIHGARA